MSENYLVHHGILGQKWGVRRYQNKDGTLTDQGRKHQNDIVFKKGSTFDHLSGQKKLKLRGNVDPELATAAAIATPLVPTLGVQLAKEAINSKDSKKLFVYDDSNDHDRAVYEGAFSKFVVQKKINDNIRKGKDFTTALLENDIYKHKYVLKDDLISPSQERRAELFVETFRKNKKLMSNQLDKIDKHVQKSNLAPVLKDKSGKISDYKNVSDEDLKKYGYTMFNIANEFKDPASAKMNSKYYKVLQKNGYNALIDDNNKDIYNKANNPLIVLDAKKHLKEISSEELTLSQQKEAEERLRKNLKKMTGSDNIVV